MEQFYFPANLIASLMCSLANSINKGRWSVLCSITLNSCWILSLRAAWSQILCFFQYTQVYRSYIGHYKLKASWQQTVHKVNYKTCKSRTYCHAVAWVGKMSKKSISLQCLPLVSYLFVYSIYYGVV